MMPDILVTRCGSYVCAVEIGYTRPEKLTAYRNQLKIPDVRWYDKQGRLHGDVRETVSIVTVAAQPARDVSVYYVWDMVQCAECPEVAWLDRRVPQRCEARYARLFGEDALLDRDARVWEIEHQYVYTMAITDHVRMWLPSHCDKCDHDWMATPHEDAPIVASELDAAPRDIGVALGARTLLTWDAARADVQNTFGLELEYFDGYLIDPTLASKVDTEIHAALRRR